MKGRSRMMQLRTEVNAIRAKPLACAGCAEVRLMNQLMLLLRRRLVSQRRHREKPRAEKAAASWTGKMRIARRHDHRVRQR